MFHSLFIGLIEYIQYLTKYFYTLFLYKYLFLFLFSFKTLLKHSAIHYFASFSCTCNLLLLIDSTSHIDYKLYLNFKSFFTESQMLRSNRLYNVINFNHIPLNIGNVSLASIFLKIHFLPFRF